jgi:hypothetical protein
MENQEQECILLSLSNKENATKSDWIKLQTHPEDDIYYRFGNPPMQRHTEVSLTAGENVTWWKGIEFVKENTLIRQIETQDGNHGPNEFGVGIDNFDRPENYTLFLCKAKEFGIHRRMYQIPGEHIFYNRIEFYWQKD